MSTATAFQLYLLSQMRARDRINNALTTLGVGYDALATAVVEIKEYGMEEPGHPMEAYTRVIGEPVLREWHLNTADPYREVAAHYSLPLWPLFRLSVYGNLAGQTAGICFTPKPERQIVEIGDNIESLGAWDVVEEQVRALLAGGRVVDEWYPQRDYEVLSQTCSGSSAAKYVLRFDFKLLQDIVRL